MDYEKQQKQWLKREAEIERLMDKGWTSPMIAAKYGFTKQRALQIMWRIQKDADMDYLIDNGFDASMISKKYGCSLKVAKRMLRRAKRRKDERAGIDQRSTV